MSDLAFEPEVEAAIMRHMNNDHPEDSVLICKALGGEMETRSAAVTAVDRKGIDFAAETPTGTASIRVEWAEPILERAQVRTEVVRIYQDACAILGITPREADGSAH